MLCLLPVLVAWFIEQSRVAPITANKRTLAKYTGIVPLGGSAISVLEVGRKVEFVEELPDWNGSKTIGVKVWVPKSARQAVKLAANVDFVHSRNGQQLFYGQGFRWWERFTIGYSATGTLDSAD